MTETSQTSQTIAGSGGAAMRVVVGHDECVAIAYDFYVPQRIWDDPAVKLFLDKLRSMENNATYTSGSKGLWHGREEDTRIFRLILNVSATEQKSLRNSFQEEIGRMMAGLAIIPGHEQHAVLFTETRLRVSLSTRKRENQSADAGRSAA